MKPLDLDRLNRETPYHVYPTDEVNRFVINTDHDVKYSVYFDEDDFLLSGESYQFGLTNTNHKKSPRDLKIRDTILLLIEEFFRQNNVSLLYICETGDGKQIMRSRLFDHWYMSYQRNWQFVYMSASITDAEGIRNFAAMIVRKDNPNLTQIVSEFSETVQLLNDKPEHEQ